MTIYDAFIHDAYIRYVYIHDEHRPISVRKTEGTGIAHDAGLVKDCRMSGAWLCTL